MFISLIYLLPKQNSEIVLALAIVPMYVHSPLGYAPRVGEGVPTNLRPVANYLGVCANPLSP